MSKGRPPNHESVRLKVLKAVGRRVHRYDRLRVISQSFSLLVLVAVPLLGIARVDFWRGHHYLLMRPAPLKHALAGVILGIGAMYVLTFLSNVVAGRLFCGWGCPVGQVSRFGEHVDTPGLKGKARLRANLEGALYSAVFVIAVLCWWVDWRMLLFGSPGELAIAWGLVAIGTAGAFAHGRWWRWEFCKQVCPIGLYYTFMAPAKYFGIHFRNQQATCIECDACDHICPVQLKPRELEPAMPMRGGLSIADASGFNHCLECGDCIRACEEMIRLRGHDPVPLRMGYFSGPQRVDVEQPSETPSPTEQTAEEEVRLRQPVETLL